VGYLLILYFAEERNMISYVKDPVKRPVFGYSSPLKALVNLDAYTGKILKKGQISVEHIKPHSKGGANNLANYLIVGRDINSKRGNQDFREWIKQNPFVVPHIQEYLNKYRELKVDGVDYVQTVKKTLNKEAKGVVTFMGNPSKTLDIKA
jgi:hypothetical protein